MKTSLSHLPEGKKSELRQIVKKLLEYKEVEMIILFGSYATGEYVHCDRYEEAGIIYEYRSDYDLLIILSQNNQADNVKFIHNVSVKLNALNLFTPISPIFEGAGFVNGQLSEGNYFFNEIKSKGIRLYDSKRKKLVRKRKLSNEEVKIQAEEYFRDWFKSAGVFYENFETNLSKSDKGQVYLNTAAFLLHQATERYYHTLTLVFTGYKHKTHDIEKLDRVAAGFDLEFKKIFPRKTKEQNHHFNLLKNAYIDSRYKKGYSITPSELDYLAVRVQKLKELVGKVCGDKIDGFSK